MRADRVVPLVGIPVACPSAHSAPAGAMSRRGLRGGSFSSPQIVP